MKFLFLCSLVYCFFFFFPGPKQLGSWSFFQVVGGLASVSATKPVLVTLRFSSNLPEPQSPKHLLTCMRAGSEEQYNESQFRKPQFCERARDVGMPVLCVRREPFSCEVAFLRLQDRHQVNGVGRGGDQEVCN